MKAFLVAAALALVSGPALAQYGGGGHNSGGPLGSYLRQGGGYHGYGYRGGYGYRSGGYEPFGYAPAYGYAAECYVVPRRYVDGWGRVFVRPMRVCG